MNFVCTLLVAVLLASFGSDAAAASDRILADFEGNDYSGWSVEGEAFGQRPAAGTLPNQQPVGGFLGRRLVNSYRDGDGTTGSMTSTEFTIDRDYLALLVGGGHRPGEAGVELIIDGQTVRQVTGSDAEILDWRVWDVRDLLGKRGRVRIYDHATGDWGHINVDHIILTNQAMAAGFDVDAYRASGEYYQEPHRPQFHFSPEVNWMNDPNGLVYFEGEYHLFYQCNPFGISWGHMSWGHAVSTDLVHWRHLPVALYEEDGEMIFSGSAVVDWKNTSGFGQGASPPIIAIYTGHQPGNESQCIAYSVDRGRTWKKYAGNPVLDITNADFRDPKVFWHGPTGQWVMVVALAAEKRVQFYSSADLKSWKLLSEFGPAGAPDAPNWECPDLFELPIEGKPGRTKWVLQISIGGHAVAGGSGGQYFVGEFDGRTFMPDDPQQEPRWVDFGRDFYAAVSWSDIPREDGRRIWIGWLKNWEAGLSPRSRWQGGMSIPRTLALRESPDGLRLVQHPVVELQKLRAEHLRLASKVIDGNLSNELEQLQSFHGDALEIVAEFDIGEAREVGLLVRVGDRESTKVGFSAVEGQVFIDRTKSGRVEYREALAGRHSAPLEADQRGHVKLHVLVDRSSIEVFGNDGACVITDLVFPQLESQGLQAYADGGEARLVSLNAWKLDSIWREK